MRYDSTWEVETLCATRAHGNFSNGRNYRRHNSRIGWPRGGNPRCLLVSENFQDRQASRVCPVAASRSRASSLSSRIGPLLDTQRLGKGDPNRVTRTRQPGSSTAGVRRSRARQESQIKSHNPPKSNIRSDITGLGEFSGRTTASRPMLFGVLCEGCLIRDA
jgi:hypothetical protein